MVLECVSLQPKGRVAYVALSRRREAGVVDVVCTYVRVPMGPPLGPFRVIEHVAYVGLSRRREARVVPMGPHLGLFRVIERVAYFVFS